MAALTTQYQRELAVRDWEKRAVVRLVSQYPEPETLIGALGLDGVPITARVRDPKRDKRRKTSG